MTRLYDPPTDSAGHRHCQKCGEPYGEIDEIATGRNNALSDVGTGRKLAYCEHCDEVAP